MESKKTSEQKIIQKPAFPINEKGLSNHYTKEHLENKNISMDLVKQCLAEGAEVTNILKAEKRYTLKGHRYFKLELPDLNKKYIPGKITLPDPRGESAGEVVNWNFFPLHIIRNGRVVPVILENDVPDWLKRETCALYVVVTKNQKDNSALWEKDGPTEEDLEGSWFVVTAHFGPPSQPKPKVPDLIGCANEKERAEKLKNYLEKRDAWQKENERTYYIVGEEEYEKLAPKKSEDYKKEKLSEEDILLEIKELREKNKYQQGIIEDLIKQAEKMHREINDLSSNIYRNKNSGK